LTAALKTKIAAVQIGAVTAAGTHFIIKFDQVGSAVIDFFGARST
jgi:hypothetical protein